MKMLLLLFCFTIFNFSITESNLVHTHTENLQGLKVIFDGYEGGYYFFTDQNTKALQLTKSSHPILTNQKFENGNYIGKSFLVTLKNNDETNSFKKEVLHIAMIH